MAEMYDVIVEGYNTPFATDKSFEEAERIDISMTALRDVRDSMRDRNTRMRKNPASAEGLQDVESQIAFHLGFVPSTKKEALKEIRSQDLDKRLNSTLAELYNRLDALRIKTLAANISNSVAASLQSDYDLIINSGMVEQIIAARYRRFESLLPQAQSVSFESLNEADQNFVVKNITALEVFFDVSNAEDFAAFNVESYTNTLVLFKSDKLILDVMELLSSVDAEAPILAHFGAPFMQVIYIASEVESDTSKWLNTADRRDSKIKDAFEIFSDRRDVISKRDARSICELLQTGNIVDTAQAAAITILLQKKDSAEVSGSDELKDILIAADVVEDSDNLEDYSPCFKIAALAMTISVNKNRDKILAQNYKALKSAKKALNILRKNFGQPLTVLPIVALDYATCEDLNTFDTYFEWGLDLVYGYMNKQTFNAATWSSCKKRTETLVISQDLLSDTLEYIRKLRTAKLRKIVNTPNSPFNPKADLSDFDFNQSSQHSDFTDEYLDFVKNNNFEKEHAAIFGDKGACITDALQLLWIASMNLKKFDNPSKKELAFREITVPHSDTDGSYRVFVSRKYNPLSMMLGLSDFWDCCLALWSHATSCASLTFCADTLHCAVVSFGMNLPNEDKRLNNKGDIVCTVLNTFGAVSIKGENVYVPITYSLELVNSPTHIELLLANPDMSVASRQFAANPNAEIKGVYSIGGGERSREQIYKVPQKYYEESAVVHLKSMKSNSVLFEKSAAIYLKNIKFNFESADRSVGLLLKPEALKHTSFANEISSSMKFTGVKLGFKAYAELTKGTGTSMAAGFDFISDAGSAFTKMNVSFQRQGGDASVTYTTKSNAELSLDVSWDELRYMFAFPTAPRFVPFGGAVEFESPDADACVELLFPKWFESANKKPLIREGKSYRAEDLIALRTPKGGLAINGTQYS